MKTKIFLRRSGANLLVLQFLFLFLMIQVLQIPIVPQQAAASPSTRPDNIWEDPDGIGPLLYNSQWDWAYNFTKSESTRNPELLNVSSSNPDYYGFNVEPGFYFSISITFNQSNAWNETGFGPTNNLIDLDPPFYADLDIYLWSESATLLGYSNYSGDEEIISPILINTSETLRFNVTCSNPFGYEGIQYSTTYNMSVVYEDKWERFESNDFISDLTPPDNPGGSDDEIVPGHYEKLRFSSDPVTEYGENDSYLILLYKGSWVNITVTSYLDPIVQGGPPSPESNGLNLTLLYYNRTLAQDLPDPDTNNPIDNFIFTVQISSWYFLVLERNNANFYTLDITIEDAAEIESGNNHLNNSATGLGAGTYPGMVVSENNSDWYKVAVAEYERLRVDVTWVPVKLPDGSKLELNLTVYNQTFDSVSDPLDILGGVRFGPHRAFSDSVFYLHISSNNPYPLYYNLTIAILGKDDWAEINDGILTAYILPTQSKEYKPTESNPDGGLISLEGNQDWFGIYLLPGDWITVRIDFDGSHADLNLFLVSQDAEILDDSTLSGSSSENISYNVRKADIYLLLVFGIGPSGYGFADYNLTVNIDLFDDEFELPNNDFSTAAPIAEGNYTDLILRDDLYDYYYVYLHEADLINISLDYFPEEYEEAGDTLVNDIDLEFYFNDSGIITRIAESITVLNESISFNASDSGKYFILCVIWGGETPNSYNLTINILETDDAHEDNDIFGDATRISMEVENDTVTNHYETARIRIKDDDYFVVKVPNGFAIQVEISQFGSNNLDLELLSKNGSTIAFSTNDAGYPEQCGPFVMNTSYNTLYAKDPNDTRTDIYFRVFMSTGLSTSYFLNITIGPPEVLIPQESVPPIKPKPTKKVPSLLEALIPLVVGGVILGGGAAGGLYAAKKTGYLDKGIKKFKELRKKPPKKPEGGTTGEIKKPDGGATGGIKKPGGGMTGGVKKKP